MNHLLRSIFCSLLLAAIPVLARAGDYGGFPPGDPLVYLQESSAGFETDHLVIPPGRYHFIFFTNESETYLLRSAKGGHPVVFRSEERIALQPGAYEITRSSPTANPGVLHLSVRSDGRGPYPTVVFTATRKSWRLSTRRVVSGIVHLHVVDRLAGSFCLHGPNHLDHIPIMGTVGGKPFDIYVMLHPGQHFAVDPVMGLESPPLTVTSHPKGSS